MGFIRVARRSWLTCLAAAQALAAIAVVTPVLAADLDVEVLFHIDAQPLDSALLQFSKQANTPVAFAAKSVVKMRTTGLDGRFAVRTALTALLCNSGLAFTQVGDMVTVVPTTARTDVKSCSVPGVISKRE